MTASASPARAHGARRRFAVACRRVLAEVGRTLRGHDLNLIAAGVTFYAGIAVVPSLLVALRLGSVVAGPRQVTEIGRDVAAILPDAMGAPGVVDRLVSAGVHLTWVGVLITLFPASFYGEGLRRAFLRLVPPDQRAESFIGWRGRLLQLPLLAVVPLLLDALLLITPTLSRLSSEGGATASVAGVLIGFYSVWLLLAVPIGWVFSIVAPGGGLSWPAVVAGALGTSSFISGFLQGFVLFLSFPIDLGSPFGGLTVIGGVVAVGFWLLVLHTILLVGYVTTRALESQLFGPRRERRQQADGEGAPAGSADGAPALAGQP